MTKERRPYLRQAVKEEINELIGDVLWEEIEELARSKEKFLDPELKDPLRSKLFCVFEILRDNGAIPLLRDPFSGLSEEEKEKWAKEDFLGYLRMLAQTQHDIEEWCRDGLTVIASLKGKKGWRPPWYIIPASGS